MHVTGPYITETVLVVECREELDLRAYWNLDFDGTELPLTDPETGELVNDPDPTLLYARVAFPTLAAAQHQFRIEKAAREAERVHRPRPRPVRGGTLRRSPVAERGEGGEASEQSQSLDRAEPARQPDQAGG